MSNKLEATFHGADIITRLRAYGPHSDYEDLMREAADEIARLRDALSQNLDNGPVDLDSEGTPHDTRSRAYRLGHQDGWWLRNSGVTHETPAADAQRCDPYKGLGW